MEAVLPDSVNTAIKAGIEYIYSLAPLVEPTVVLVPSIVRVQVSKLSDAIGFDVETLNYTLGLFLCYPLAIIMGSLPYGKIRHIFSFLLGVFLLQFTLGIQWIHQLVTSLVVYVMLLVLPRKVNTIAVPVFIMLYMVMGHLHRLYINYLGYDLDFTGAQMVLTQKLYMIAYNLYDGQVLDRISSGKKVKKDEERAASKCSPYALKDVPDIIEYLGYTFCFSNVLSGPATEFVTYCKTCDGSLLYDIKTGKPLGSIPSNVWPTIQPFLVSLLVLGGYVVGNQYFPLLDPTDPKRNIPVVLTEQFLQYTWPYRYAYMWLGLVIVRTKYYFAWKNAEGANNLWYAGFEGFDTNGQPKGWDNACNMDIIKFETAQSLQVLSKEWNKKTSLWLTRYVYIRTGGSLVATYGMSAFWHGFYPGYYLFFMSVPMLTICERIIKKKISPLFAKDNFVYGIVCMIVTSVFVEYTVAPFPLLAFDWSWNNWKSHYFFGHIGCILFYIVMIFVPTPKSTEKKD